MVSRRVVDMNSGSDNGLKASRLVALLRMTSGRLPSTPLLATTAPMSVTVKVSIILLMLFSYYCGLVFRP